ncbi:hypothetical protein Glove_413g28 [Diversispora epigaea]|uniref:Uncharacterized protein n=1 Tax=Diversispora epigaea TaxID=1348612 RepID=A0A397H5B8_9GLOM|nr:hypothetical protein Glove_413g28 [Diversispora epigaea]
MVNQEIQTSDTVPICTCEHADEINRYVKKELGNLSRQLLGNNEKTFDSFMQEITKQFEEQVNINNKLRSEIDRQKNNLSNNYIMVNQEIQTSDTVPICTCEHADEINRYVKKELGNLSRQLLGNNEKTFDSFMQEITKQFEEQVNINNKLRSEIDRQKLLLQDMEIKLASLKSRSTY